MNKPLPCWQTLHGIVFRQDLLFQFLSDKQLILYCVNMDFVFVLYQLRNYKCGYVTIFDYESNHWPSGMFCVMSYSLICTPLTPTYTHVFDVTEDHHQMESIINATTNKNEYLYFNRFWRWQMGLAETLLLFPFVHLNLIIAS